MHSLSIEFGASADPSDLFVVDAVTQPQVLLAVGRQLLDGHVLVQLFVVGEQQLLIAQPVPLRLHVNVLHVSNQVP